MSGGPEEVGMFALAPTLGQSGPAVGELSAAISPGAIPGDQDARFRCMSLQLRGANRTRVCLGILARSALSFRASESMDTTQATLLSLEAMGTGGLPGTATTRGERARSMAHQQVGAWPVGLVQDPGAPQRTCLSPGPCAA